MTITSSIAPYAPIDSLPAYQAGRALMRSPRSTACTEAIKLASNESPFGPLPSVAAAIRAATEHINRYPDVSATPLRQALATRHELDIGEVTIGAGSTGVLYQLSRAYLAPGDEVVMHAPSFEAYPIIVTLAQADPVAVPMSDGHTDARGPGRRGDVAHEARARRRSAQPDGYGDRRRPPALARRAARRPVPPRDRPGLRRVPPLAARTSPGCRASGRTC